MDLDAVFVAGPTARMQVRVTGPTLRTQVRVTGTVQGVGFRPFVYRHAVSLGLRGQVLNDSEGVLIDVEGDPLAIAELLRRVSDDPPPLARVKTVTASALTPGVGLGAFRIVESLARGAADVPVSVDTTTCDECLAEIDDPADRRYRYAFTNCTDCGPRYTIVLGVPYDRPATTMADFEMCELCRREYDDPADRRFHAQPNACPDCGPQLQWVDMSNGAPPVLGTAALDATIADLLAGRIMAIKGIGGYHLVADATNADATRELRRRKARDDKPFAVMVASLSGALEVASVDAAAAAALSSLRRPIVLVPRRPGTAIAEAVAPGLPELGVLLAYSPLHHLLLAGTRRPLVMTSGNLSDDPIAHHDDDAVGRLGPLVDSMLIHNRPIHIRCDDSVVRATPTRVQTLRRSRGFAPEPLLLPFRSKRQVLAVGAELKNTISVAKNDWVVASHHIGDLEHLATYRSFQQAVEHLARLYGVVPEVVAHDMHPEYLSSKYAADLELPVVAVQHHHAHVAACMVEHGRTSSVLGITYDGLGYGPDGSLWGGEMLVADFGSFERVAHLRPMRMPGGSAAIREPWRMAAVWAAAALGPHAALERLRNLGVDETIAQAVLDLASGPSSPSTTSAGRLFDAVAALLGGRTKVSYEAQAAIELEALARTVSRSDAPRYGGTITVSDEQGMLVLDPVPLIGALVADIDRGVDRRLMAAGFHEALGRATVDVAATCLTRSRLDTVVLTGGVFQNARMTEVVETGLRELGATVLVPTAVPTNDGGISVGQAAIAAYL